METGDEINSFSFFAYCGKLPFVKKVLSLNIWHTKMSSAFYGEFYGLKASQMNKVRASSHEYPHVEKNQQPSKVRQATSNWIVTIKYTQ